MFPILVFEGEYEMTKDTKALISVCSYDIEVSQLQSALIDNDVFIATNFYDENATRGFQDVEWLMFLMMAIPTLDSAMSIAVVIKNEITQRISQHLRRQKATKKSKIIMKIKLPGFSYEKEEEIIINPTQDD